MFEQQPTANPMESIVTNLVSCINNRINAEKFDNRDLLSALQLFLTYAAACPVQPMSLPDAIGLFAQQNKVPISKERAYEIAKQVSDMLIDDAYKKLGGKI